MKITSISAQQSDPNRVNVSVDGKFRFSLDIFQLVDLGVKVGRELSEDELSNLQDESTYCKLYTKSLEYSMMRPHSSREMRDYLWRKTVATKYKSRSGDIKERPGVAQGIADRVYNRLLEKGYINDEKFARWWVENRNQRKGVSQRKLQAELRAKGVESSIIDLAMTETERNDSDELAKIIAKKRSRYNDDQKLMAYLARLGFSYDDIKSALGL